MKFYPYPSHYIFDILVMLMMLLLGKQLYNLTVSKKQGVAFIAFMMMFYQINFYITEVYFDRSFKYPVLYLGLVLAYMIIVRLNLISAMIVILTTAALNGIWTNLNLAFMLTFVYENYGVALEHKQEQYGFYMMTIVIMSSLLMLLKVRIFDIQKYS